MVLKSFYFGKWCWSNGAGLMSLVRQFTELNAAICMENQVYKVARLHCPKTGNKPQCDNL